MARVKNFNAGPATLPLAALERAHRELLDIDGTGMSIMEHSHRGKTYDAVHAEALSLVRELLAVPEDYHVLLLQGGASQQFAMVPMNLLPEGKSADYVVTGSWSKKAVKEAKAVGQVNIAASTEKDGKFVRIPKQSELSLSDDAAYVHITTNNTIAGTQWHELPDTGKVPLVADMSSDIMWKPTDVSKFGLIYAGAQKNLGPSGVTLVIAKKDLVAGANEKLPAIFQYRTHADANSLYNTPPTFGIYILRNVLAVVKQAGGLSAMEKHNREKAKVLYDAIDARADFYRCPVEKDSRSVMNVVFNLPTPELEAEFIAEAQKQGMVGLKGHRSVGGVRASIYNAADKAWLEALAGFMKTFKA
ncbi:MAG: 3-phosphoserine/phosphohydroxythreonine transaminase [Myxococcales bacterium]|nr:3-phosphoserine/phosphohydroxythreonine transaminase [Myxococcales bacterium]MCB9577161.1 3-phosphoserine/phosphohydroxythreonine transaminase [Polyangiaceae bacterium]